MADESRSLEELRAAINGVDREILKLLNERIGLVKQVGAIKGKGPIYRPEREAQLLRALIEENEGPLGSDRIEAIFREVISSSYQYERPLCVATLGPQGTYSQMALHRKFGTGVEASLLRSIDEVFRAVDSGAADYGLVPVENSLEGSVGRTLDCFWGSALNICGEIELPIHHSLLAVEGARLESIERVYGHAQALGQSRQWLDAHLRRPERVAVDSSGEAIERVVSGEGCFAAVAGDLAKELSGLASLADNIEDFAGNTTRFLIIGDQEIPPSGEDKTTVCVQLRDQPGELLRMLEPIQRCGVDMKRIESRPLRQESWSYLFFIDLIGHREDPALIQVLDDIRKMAVRFKWLGSYPRHLT
ncbi:MAG: prephenate dehydratase [Gammaproteobacteria bacterium AqS3]|nr:prephenate dehydratase [Gammaproteobacteria bacterium AqS3]